MFLNRFILNSWALLLCFTYGLLAPCVLSATPPQIRDFTLQSNDNAYLVSANLSVTLPKVAIDALHNNVSLSFTLTFHLTSYRWYWPDKLHLVAERHYKINWNSLTQQYRLYIAGILLKEYRTLDELLHTVSRVHAWPVEQHAPLQLNAIYDATLRFAFNPDLLPSPFRIDFFTDSNLWQLDSGVKHWHYLHTRGQQK